MTTLRERSNWCKGCRDIRVAEVRGFVSCYSHGRCDKCKTELETKSPRCWSCGYHPGPRDNRLACRSCTKACIRKVRREHEFLASEYNREVEKHEEWVNSLDFNTRCWYESRYTEPFAGSYLDPPDKHKFYWERGPIPDILLDRRQASEFLRRFPNYIWDYF